MNNQVNVREKAGDWSHSEGQQIPFRGLRDGSQITADSLLAWTLEGRVFVGSAIGDQDDGVTGQVSPFAVTTPTFLLSVPKGVTVVPLYFDLVQALTVAGNTIVVQVEIDRETTRYSSGGTTQKAFCTRTGMPNKALAVLRTNPTGTSGYGIRVAGFQVGQDVAPAEGMANGIYWRPPVPIILDGPAALVVYTYAGTTAPSWTYEFGWAELPA